MLDVFCQYFLFKIFDKFNNLLYNKLNVQKAGDLMTLGDIIKKYRQEHSMSMDSFSEKSGISKAYISLLEKNKHPKTGKPIAPSLQCIKQAAEGMKMDFNELFAMLDGNVTLNESTPIHPITNLYPIELKKFPLLGEISCGVPKFANEDRESYVMAGTDIKADFCLKAKGDSMINARINDGDIVFIRKQDMVENGEIAAVIINDNNDALLKRFYYYADKGLMILKPENPAYEDKIYTGEELNQVHILGKAIAFQSDV